MKDKKTKRAGDGTNQPKRARQRPIPGQATYDAVKVILGADASGLFQLLDEEADSILGKFFAAGRRWRRLAPPQQVSGLLALQAKLDLRLLFAASESIEAVCTRPEWHMANFIQVPRFSKAAAKAFVAGVRDAYGVGAPW